MRRALFIAVVLHAGCLRQTQFHCDNDSSCGPGGRCETDVGFCSTTDNTCSSGRRFGDSAGGLADTCVGAPNSGSDGSLPGSDGSDGSGSSGSDGSGSNMGQCPGDYMSISGGNSGHVYKVENPSSWMGANGHCMVETQGHGYLAIPDDPNELMGLAGLSSGFYWVGITDLQQPGTFVNTKNQTQTFLPWAPGQPDDTGQRHCAEGIDASQIAQEKCLTTLSYACECEQ